MSFESCFKSLSQSFKGLLTFSWISYLKAMAYPLKALELEKHFVFIFSVHSQLFEYSEWTLTMSFLESYKLVIAVDEFASLCL